MKLHVAIPILKEADNLIPLFINLKSQSFKNFKLWTCVNNPDAWHYDSKHQNDVLDNARSLKLLSENADIEIVVIDKSSKGKGFDNKVAGVGLARKILMDAISSTAHLDDIIVSLDADTSFNVNYFESLKDNFLLNKDASGISVPYYHPLTTDRDVNYCMLRYEIYMRHYTINMLKINNPYSFTALGSAIALPVSVYNKIGGITPRKSGEDFYLLQSLRKNARLVLWNSEHVYPQARLSDRVSFGTGPALIKGLKGNFSSYPFFNNVIFDEIKETFESFPLLYEKDMSSPMIPFLQSIFKTNDLWSPLRKNYKSIDQFVHACMVKIDALRIFQYLKYRQKFLPEEKYVVSQYTRDFLYDTENYLRKNKFCT